MDEIIKKAMDVFGVPAHRPNFLFLLPAFYVAKADGKISMKEIMAIGYNSVKLGLVGIQEQDSEDFNLFLENMVEQFQAKTNSSELNLLANAINARLAGLAPEKVKAIRERIYELCFKVADASGPIIGDHISGDERHMLERIFNGLEKKPA